MNTDFNSDGKENEAKILVGNDNSGIGLFVFLSIYGNPIVLLLDTVEGKDALSYMGIYPVKPGKYITAFGKGYDGNWPEDEPERIILENTGIDFFCGRELKYLFLLG